MSIQTKIDLPINVYIEDTDAYAVVFYANYIKYWERAAVKAIGAANVETDDGKIFGIHSANGMRYVAAGTLGDACVASVELLGVDENGRLAASASFNRASDNAVLCSASDLRFEFTSGGASVDWPLDPVEGEAPADPCDVEVGPPPTSGSSPYEAGLTLQLDEASPGGTLSLHACMRYFERHRTLFLGGPSGLQSLADAGVNVVVGRINSLRLLPAACSVRVGTPLELRCRAILKARNTQILFEQWLTTPEGVPLARADVTCICTDGKKMCSAPEAAIAEVQKYAESSTVLLSERGAVPAGPTPNRRSWLAAAAAAMARPQIAFADFFGYEDGKAMQQKNAELETSPLIEELKRRTEANKERNAAIVKEASTGAQGGVYDETQGVKMVRYAAEGDALPVTRIMNPEQVKQMEALGFKLNCPSWGGACEVKAPK